MSENFPVPDALNGFGHNPAGLEAGDVVFRQGVHGGKKDHREAAPIRSVSIACLRHGLVGTMNRLRLWATVLLLGIGAGCAGPASGPDSTAPPPDSPCAVCTVAFDVCRKRDDYNPCLGMRRYCTNWCASAETCAEACEGARWGCDADVDLRRSTCDRIETECAARCAAIEFTDDTDERRPVSHKAPKSVGGLYTTRRRPFPAPRKRRRGMPLTQCFAC